MRKLCKYRCKRLRQTAYLSLKKHLPRLVFRNPTYK